MKMTTVEALDERTGQLRSYVFPDFRENIDNGIIFLDKVKPGWRKSINPATLKLESTTYCVCGQVFAGHYREGMEKLSECTDVSNFDDGTLESSGPIMLESYRHGFIAFRPEDVREIKGQYVENDVQLPFDFQDIAREADEVWEWAERYSDSFDDELWMKTMYSALAEQWITAINGR